MTDIIPIPATCTRFPSYCRCRECRDWWIAQDKVSTLSIMCPACGRGCREAADGSWSCELCHFNSKRPRT